MAAYSGGDYGYTVNNTTMFVTNDNGRHDDSNGGFQEAWR